MYSSFALGSEAGLPYSSVGNPGPDFVADYRKGDNLYTCGVVVLVAKTGQLKGYHQFVKNVITTGKAGRKMVAAACKNGYLYGLDRDLAWVAIFALSN